MLRTLVAANPDEVQEKEITKLIHQQQELLQLLNGFGVAAKLDQTTKQTLQDFKSEVAAPMSAMPRMHEPPVSDREKKVLDLVTDPTKLVEKLDTERCRYDVIYLASKLFHIKYRLGLNEQSPDAREGYLTYTTFQRQIIRLLLEGLVADTIVRLMCLKARQEGFTTTFWSFWTFLVLTRRNWRVFFIIDKNEHSAEKKKMVIDWLRACEEALPWAPKIVGGTSGNTIMLDNGSILHFDSAEADNPGSSLNVDVVHTSEETKWKQHKAREIKESMFPGVPTRGFSVIVRESTAKGMEAFFQDYKTARKGKSEFIPIFVPWFASQEYQLQLIYEEEKFWMWENLDPMLRDYDADTDTELTEQEYATKYGLTKQQIKWRRYQIRTTYGGSRASFDQEYPTSPDHAFRKQGWQFFSTMLLGKLEHGLREPLFRGRIQSQSYIDAATPIHWGSAQPVLLADLTGSLCIFEWPVPGETYFAGGDTAEGIQTLNARGDVITDRTVLVVKNSAGRNVAYYITRDKVETAWVEFLLVVRYYNNAWLNVELDKDGISLRTYILRTGYPNNVVHPGTGSTADRTWTRTTPPQRRLILSLARKCISSIPGAVPYREHWDEMLTFIQDANTGKPEGASGEHDDIVMADAQAEFCRNFYNPTVMPEAVTPEVEPRIQLPTFLTEVPLGGFKVDDTTLPHHLMWRDADAYES